MGFAKLYIEPTSACNLNCSMCFRKNWIDEKIGFMTDATFDRVIKGISDAESLESVMFGGMGEPLLHGNIAEMIRSFSVHKIKTELITNATMLTKQTADRLAETGLDTLWVSVDGFERSAYEKIQKGSDFDLIINNIKYFNKVRKNCKTGMSFVIMDNNIDELVKINGFADELSFDFINLSYAVPSAPLKITDSCYDTGFCTGKNKRVDFSTFNFRRLNYCPFAEGDNCFVKWNGDVTACMQLLHSSYSYLYEEKRKITAKSFGNVNREALNDIWESGEFTRFRERVKKFEFPDCTVCDGCDDRLENRADCMYNEFPTCGACLWAQGVGRCP
ncbi:MAG: radical SAM protein [Clostridia bacterium]|nr:radical SAM protein [Clostridia bacterium]